MKKWHPVLRWAHPRIAHLEASTAEELSPDVASKNLSTCNYHQRHCILNVKSSLESLEHVEHERLL